MVISFTEFNTKEAIPKLEITLDKKYKETLEKKLATKFNRKEYIEIIDLFKKNIYKNRNLLIKLRYFNLHERYADLINVLKLNITSDPANVLQPLLNWTDDELVCLINLCINDYVLKSSNLININNINFEFGFFDLLGPETLPILEDIFKSTNNTYIDSHAWKDYACNHLQKIPINNNVDYERNLFFKYEPIIISDDIIRKKNPSKEDLINTSGTLYEDTVNNEEDLLYAFLNMVLLCNSHFVIKKCNLCHKFFIATRIDVKTCNRINENGKTCNHLRINANKISSSNTFVKKMEKHIKDLFSSETKYNEKENFLKEYKIKRKELSGKEYLYWLISHYSKPDIYNKRKIEIDTYIKSNKDFETEFIKKYH